MLFILKSGLWKESIEAKDIDEAMAMADGEISYNQCSMSIMDEDGECLASRKWWGCLDGLEECENPVQYGEFGYYGDWSVE